MLRAILIPLILVHLTAAALARDTGRSSLENRHLPALTQGRGRLVVRGLDGQANLRIDPGRSLRGYPLRKVKARPWLSSVEKVRLDARRIALASKLSPRQKLERFVHIARHRMPLTSEAGARYEKGSAKQVQRWGESRLSQHVRKKTGICRERAFLLWSMLGEIGHKAKVRYGVLYDNADNYVDGHAWVETTLGGRPVILDPSMRQPIQAKKPLSVNETLPNGATRRVTATQTPDYLYVPTSDIYLSSPGS
jgi:hypothetical protein